MKMVLITSSILIIVMAVLRPLLRRKINPQVQYALWLAVVLRLLIPVNFVDSAYSALALLDRAVEPAQLVESIGQTSIPAQSYDSARAQVLEEYRRQGVEEAALTPSDLMAIDNQARELMKGPTLAELAARYAKPVWLGGGLVMGAWFLVVNLRLRRRLKDAILVEADSPLLVYLSDALPSPCLYGVVRPAIYVTPSALENPDRLRHVLAHELTHYRHKDHWWALVRCLCLCVYWFDPLVWWAAALSRQDCELACDEGAIRRLGEEERLPYGRTLVDMIAAGRTPLLQTATTMTGGKRRVRERIKLVACGPRTVIAAALALAVVLGLAVGCTFTGAPEDSHEPTESVQPTDATQPTLDTLRERLGNIPEDLRPEVVNRADIFDDTGVLASYWWETPIIDWEDESLPWLLSVYRWDQARLNAEGYPDTNDTDVSEIFARDGRWYYSIVRPVNKQLEMDGLESHLDVYQAVREYAEQTVLATEGIEPCTYSVPNMGGEAGAANSTESGQPPVNSPTLEQQDVKRGIKSVTDAIARAPSVDMVLTVHREDGTSAGYIRRNVTEYGSYWVERLNTFAANFEWEAYTDNIPLELLQSMQRGGGLNISVPDGPTLILHETDNVVWVCPKEGEATLYRAVSRYGEPLDQDSSIQNPGPYHALRSWFDEVDLAALRAAIVIPDNGQSHEEIARVWAENWEGAMMKAAPGGDHSCTYVRIENVEADLAYWMEDQVDQFGFSYDVVFVPENETAREQMIAGNTGDYTGDDAPEGAMTYSRVAYMRRIGDGWTCEGTATGW